jgi:hypothetical protein
MMTAVAMILRVWAMYSRSKLILRTLLALFSMEIVSTLLADSIFQDSRYMAGMWILAELMVRYTDPLSTAIPFLGHHWHTVHTTQILDFSFCVWQNELPSLTNVVSILQMTHAAAMCILAIAQFVRQSLQMRRATKVWQLNRYMNLLVKQGILYFLGYVSLFSLLPSELANI